MTKAIRFVISLLTCVATVDGGAILVHAQARVTKPVRVILRVEAEGPEGLYVHDAKDLSSTELTQLRSLIRAEIAKLPDHIIVRADERSDAIGVVVVAAKYPNPNGGVTLLSSAITLAKADGTDSFVSHDIIAARNVAVAAKAVAFYLTSVEFRYVFRLFQR